MPPTDDHPFATFPWLRPQACRVYKFKRILPVMVGCIRLARRWTPTAVFRLYTSLELKAESERQAILLWEDGFEFEPATPDGKGVWSQQADIVGQVDVRPRTHGNTSGCLVSHLELSRRQAVLLCGAYVVWLESGLFAPRSAAKFTLLDRQYAIYVCDDDT